MLSLSTIVVHTIISLIICFSTLFKGTVTSTTEARHTIVAFEEFQSSELLFDPHLTLVVITDSPLDGCQKIWSWEYVRLREIDSVETLQKNSCKIWKHKIGHVNRHSSQGYLHKFETNREYFTEELWDRWLQVYEILTMYDGIFEFYETENSRRKSFYLNRPSLKSHGIFIFSQLNKDTFLLKSYDNNDFQAQDLLNFFGGSLPLGLQETLHQKPPIIFRYYCDGCLTASACKIKPRKSYFKEFTVQFRSNDRLFCDVFWHYNVSGIWITPQPKYVKDHYRNIIQEAPPSTLSPYVSNSINYEAKGVSFIILQTNPTFIDNLIRPFGYYVWIFMAISLIVTVVVIQLSNVSFNAKKDSYKFSRYNIFSGLFASKIESKIGEFLKNWVDFLFDILLYAYSAMLLFTMLKPSYPFTPRIYSDLNETQNILISTTKNSAVDIELVKESMQLRNEYRGDRKYYRFVADLLSLDQSSDDYRIAILIYSMDVKYYLHSRGSHYIHSAEYIHRVVISEESVLDQLQFISVSPAAPYLHFLVKGIQKIVEAGVYDKWLQMEHHFYTFVSPVMALRYLRRKHIEIKRYDEEARELGMDEFSPTLLLTAILLAAVFPVFVIEILISKAHRDFILTYIHLTRFKILRSFRLNTNKIFNGLRFIKNVKSNLQKK